jgi:hypothetical protein
MKINKLFFVSFLAVGLITPAFCSAQTLELLKNSYIYGEDIILNEVVDVADDFLIYPLVSGCGNPYEPYTCLSSADINLPMTLQDLFSTTNFIVGDYTLIEADEGLETSCYFPVVLTKDECVASIIEDYIDFEVVAGGVGLFTFPTNFVSSSTAYIGSYFTDLSEPIVLVVGTAMFMWVAGWVIGKFTNKSKIKR